jgi:hypothetical protein
MYRTVADAALIEATQRIAPLVRASRDEGERERRLPVQVLAAMHEARLFRMYIPKALDGLEIDRGVFSFFPAPLCARARAGPGGRAQGVPT